MAGSPGSSTIRTAASFDGEGMGFTQDLTRFVKRTGFQDLPPEVVHEAKRVLLDSIGCAIAGITSDKGKIAIQMARSMGGPEESSILGIGHKGAAGNVAFANGELTNALDYDAISHIPPFVIPPALALAERRGASGKELIVATVLAQETGKRISLALSSMISHLTERAEAPAVHGNGQECIFGGTLGAAKVLGLDEEKMANALGLAGAYCPVPSARKWSDTSPMSMVKYAPAGWLCLGSVTVSLLAGMGYTGDTTIFDGDYGFFRFYGSDRWDPGLVLERLGEQWRFLDIQYKPYPCCRFLHSQLDCFISIIEKNDLRPEEIESVRYWSFPYFTASPPKEVANQIDAQFCETYAVAVAAHRVRIGSEWLDRATVHDPRIREFMKKVVVGVHPEAVEAKRKEWRRYLSKVEVKARGQTFVEERMYAKGTSFTDARMTDGELLEKFKANAFKILTEDKIDRAAAMLFDLERVGDVRDLMRELTL